MNGCTAKFIRDMRFLISINLRLIYLMFAIADDGPGPSVAAGVVLVYHITSGLLDQFKYEWDMGYVVIYLGCFITSLVLAITRILKTIPNPKPIIPVTISIVGWFAMLTGAILAMRHCQVHIDVLNMTDEEIAASPIFNHDLIICALSLVGSSVYLVHAWLCYDCWWWEKKEKQMRKTLGIELDSYSNAESISNETISSNDKKVKRKPNPTVLPLPSTSSEQEKSPTNNGHRKFKLLGKLKGSSKKKSEEIESIVNLNEMLQRSVNVTETKIEDEPVRLYCCCVDFIESRKQKDQKNVPVHEFQVIHVM